MSHTPIDLRELDPQNLLVKKTTCAHGEIGPAFGEAIGFVGECLRASRAKMASMPMAVYLDWREADCDMAVGCKVEGDVALSEGCEWLTLAGGWHAVASHFGPYSTLVETHGTIRSWCAAEKLHVSGPCWESYPTDPGLEPDSSKWQTDVHYPVVKS
jgi:effector-binding domain-containing protein